MANVQKQKEKLKERIQSLESELQLSLQKKAAGPAINVSSYTKRIAELKKEFERLSS